jgi:uncharacterized protein
MTSEERKQYALHRIETAYTTLEAARYLLDGGFTDSAVSRLYYAAFHAVTALLTANGIPAKTHGAIKGQFALHFIKTGLLDSKFSKLLSELFDNRQKGDYGDITEFEVETVRTYFEPLRELIEQIELKINAA